MGAANIMPKRLIFFENGYSLRTLVEQSNPILILITLSTGDVCICENDTNNFHFAVNGFIDFCTSVPWTVAFSDRKCFLVQMRNIFVYCGECFLRNNLNVKKISVLHIFKRKS